MAQKFVSAIRHAYDSANVGRFMHRFLVEWLTQVVGWTAVDLIGSKWTLVAASGSGSCTVTFASIIQINSPSYTFSAANNGWYITLTGFSAPSAQKDGIYRIRRFVGSVGSLYTIELDTRVGVHTDGLPAQAGLNWRLWAGNDTYCPTDNTEIAVLAGRGTTGAGLSSGTRSGSLSISQSGSISTLTDTGASFQASDIGKSITVSGSGGGNDGTFVITTYLSTTQIQYTNAGGSTQGFTGTWAISYIFHVYFRVNTWGYGFGEMRVSPFAAWDPGTHNWKVGDLRYTSALGPNTPTNPIDNPDTILMWAEADSDHFTLCLLVLNTTGYPKTCPMLYAAGEMDAFYPEFDPRPCFLWMGNDGGYSAYNVYFNPIIGLGSANGHFSFYYAVRALASDDVTTLTYYTTFTHCMASSDWNILYGQRRKFSEFSGDLYRMPIMLESRTAGNMELRGSLRSAWACGTGLPLMYPQGINGEFLHVLRGFMIPWNGARNPWPITGRVVQG
jgi:hypothetical protein